MESNQFRVFCEGNKDSKKYVSILQNNINKLKRCIQNTDMQWDNDSKHWSNVSLKLYIKNNKMVSL